MPRRNLSVILVIATIAVFCFFRAHRARAGRMPDTFAQVLNLIDEEYLEPVDERVLFDGAMQGMMDQLDPNSAYFGPVESRQFQEDLDKRFGGIGIEVNVDRETQSLIVFTPLVGTPAYKAGVRAGDRIVAIDGKPTEGFGIEDAVGTLRGEVGTKVRVTIVHQGETAPIELELVRAEIEVDTILGDVRNADGSWDYFLEGQDRIGYVRVISFGPDTAADFQAAVDGLLERQMRGLIVDLRNDPGGFLDQATLMADLFLARGPIVSTRDRYRRERRTEVAIEDGTYPDFPLVVLVNGFSASASEIVAAALQDHGRAVIVGERSFGKGTVQDVIPLEGGESSLKLTTASYWRPSGHNIHRMQGATEADEWGVVPDRDCEVKLTDEQFEAVLVHRRDRDVVRGAGQSTSPDPKGAQPAIEVDPQLKKAVEVLNADPLKAG